MTPICDSGRDLPVEIVVPCFNEAKRLPVDAFAAWCEAHPQWRFRFVDDGSTDGTAEAIRGLVERVGRGHAVLTALPDNQGKAEAVRRGLLAAADAGSAFVGFFDADLATPLDDLPRLLAPLRADPVLEMAMGSRVQMLGHAVRRRVGRQFAARAVAHLAALALDLPVHDTQCGAKLMRNGPALRAALSRPFASGWIFDMELIQRISIHARDHGVADPASVFIEVPVSAWRDVADSKVRFVDACLATTRIWGIYRTRRRAERARRERVEMAATRPGSPPIIEVERVSETTLAALASPREASRDTAIPGPHRGER